MKIYNWETGQILLNFPCKAHFSKEGQLHPQPLPSLLRHFCCNTSRLLPVLKGQTFCLETARCRVLFSTDILPDSLGRNGQKKQGFLLKANGYFVKKLKPRLFLGDGLSRISLWRWKVPTCLLVRQDSVCRRARIKKLLRKNWKCRSWVSVHLTQK